jgi:predicted RNA-binding Zn-ribbon protein involved in translation (DUF1610 family)
VPDRRSWAEYRKLQRTVLIVWGAWFPVIGILILLPREWWVRLSGPFFVVGLGWGIALAFLSLRLSYWPCPGCGKLFFLRCGILPTWSKRCPHCGLRYPE